MKIIDASQFFDSIDEIQQAIDDASFQDALQECIPVCNGGFKKNFDSTQGPKGKWPPHAPYTVQKYGPHPLLILSGAMLASVTQPATEGRIESVGDRDAELGTSLFYAGWQQFGTSKIPARRFLWLDGPSVDAVLEVFADKAFQIVIGG